MNLDGGVFGGKGRGQNWIHISRAFRGLVLDYLEVRTSVWSSLERKKHNEESLYTLKPQAQTNSTHACATWQRRETGKKWTNNFHPSKSGNVFSWLEYSLTRHFNFQPFSELRWRGTVHAAVIAWWCWAPEVELGDFGSSAPFQWNHPSGCSYTIWICFTVFIALNPGVEMSHKKENSVALLFPCRSL